MAIFQNGLTVDGELILQGGGGNGLLQMNGSDITPWRYFSHCEDATTTTECNPLHSCQRLHIRTPIPLSTGAISYNPLILEVIGYHTYSGEHTSSWAALCDVRGSDGVFGSSMMWDHTAGTSYPSDPYIYASTNTYGGHKRLCFSVNKEGCCCTGYIWIRWRNYATYWDHYAWGKTAIGDSVASPRNAY